MKKANAYVADELSNKNRYLTIALSQAQNIISTLETENKRLKDVLTYLSYINNRHEHTLLESNGTLCKV